MMINIISNNFLLLLLLVIFLNLLFIKKSKTIREGGLGKISKKAKKLNTKSKKLRKPMNQSSNPAVTAIKPKMAERMQKGTKMTNVADPRIKAIEERKKLLQEWLEDFEEKYNNLLEARDLTVDERNKKRLEMEKKRNDYTTEIEVLDSYIVDNNMIYNEYIISDLILNKLETIEN